MKEIDPISQINELREILFNYAIHFRKKCEEKIEEEKPFDLFSVPAKDVTLKKNDVLNMIYSICTKLNNMRIDFDNAGIHYEDNSKVNSEFAEYLRSTYKERHERTMRLLEYQNRMYDSIKKEVRKDILTDFNKIYTKEKTKVFTTIVKSGKGGFSSEDLINYINAEIECLPQYCIKDCFDENANVKQYSERHYDTSLKIRNSLNQDDKGNSIFIFEWQRNSEGNIVQLRMRIENVNKWYNLFIND